MKPFRVVKSGQVDIRYGIGFEQGVVFYAICMQGDVLLNVICSFKYAHIEELSPSSVPDMAQGAEAQKPERQKVDMG